MMIGRYLEIARDSVDCVWTSALVVQCDAANRQVLMSRGFREQLIVHFIPHSYHFNISIVFYCQSGVHCQTMILLCVFAVKKGIAILS